MTTPSETRIARAAFWAAWLTFLALAPGYVNNVDAWVVYHANRSFVDTAGGLALRPTPDQAYAQEIPYVREGADGRRYPVFGHLFPWMTLPFYLLGRWGARPLGLDPYTLSTFTYSLANTLWAALGVGVWCRVAQALGASARSVARFAGVLVFTTPILFYAVSLWRGPGILLLLGVSVLGFLRVLERPRGADAVAFGASLALLFLYKEGNAILVAGLWIGAMVALGARDRRVPWRAAVLSGVPVAVGLGAHALVMAARFGDPFSSMYYPSLRVFAGDPWLRLGRILASPEVGLVFYAAPVVLGALAWRSLARRSRSLAVTLAVVSLVFLGLHTLVRHGEGGRFVWGPRHLVPLFPAFLLALVLGWNGAGTIRRWATAAVLTVSVLVQAMPIVQPYYLYPELVEAAPPAVAESMPSRIPGSVLVAGHLIAQRGATFRSGDLRGSPGHTWDRSGDRVLAGGSNVWWLRNDVPRAAPIAGGILVLLAAVSWWRLYRRTQSW